MAQIIPIAAGSKDAVEDAAGGGHGAAQDGGFHEGCRVGRPQHSQQDCHSRWASEAARRRREGAGSAAQPARAGQTAGGRLAEPQVTLRTLWPVAPLAPRNLLLNACTHVVEYTVVLCMVILNHIFDQAESLLCANDHWSNSQSSQWTMEWCTCAHVPRGGGRFGGGPTETRIVLRDILSDRDLLFCVPHSLINHTSQPSHQE